MPSSTPPIRVHINPEPVGYQTPVGLPQGAPRFYVGEVRIIEQPTSAKPSWGRRI